MSILTIDKYGYRRWRNTEGQLHRLEGPAVENISGSKGWYQYGKLHREEGPALEYGNEGRAWFINGKRYSKEEFKELIQR